MKSIVFKISILLNIIFLLAGLFVLYKFKDRLLAKFSSSTEARIIMYGDSRVQLADWSAGLKRNDVLNAGISGLTTPQLLDSLNSHVLKHKPQFCFIEAGINDIRSMVSLDTTFTAFQKIIDTLTANKITVVVNSVIPVSKDPFQYDIADSTINSKVEELNKRLINVCRTKGVEYLDINQALADDKKRLKIIYTLDGVHIHNRGMEVWFKYVGDCIKRYQEL